MFTIPNESDAPLHANQSEPDAVDFGILTAAHALSGVVSGGAVTAQGTPDMTVAVAVGVVAVAGVEVAVAAGNVTITAADVTNPRFDLVVVSNAGAKSAVAGTPAAEPVYPAIPADSVVLAAVYVPANETAITSGHVVDKRVFVSLNLLLPIGSTGNNAEFRGVPGWVISGGGGATAALSQYDPYTILMIVERAITIVGYDIFVNGGSEASKVLRAGLYDGDAADGSTAGVLVSDLGTASVATTGAKAVTGLSVNLTVGVYQLAFVTDAAALTLYGFRGVPRHGHYFFVGAGTGSLNGNGRWWHSYTSSPNIAADGLPDPLAGSVDNPTALQTSNEALRIPVSLRYTL